MRNAIAFALAGGMLVCQSALPDVGSTRKAEVTAHAYMVRTFLRSAWDFADGLEQQVKAPVPLASATVRAHLAIYGRKNLDDLKQAKVHLGELAGMIGRAPAEADTQASAELSRVREELDIAIGLSGGLAARLRDADYLMDRNRVRNDLIKLKDQLRTTMEDQKGLDRTFGLAAP